MKERSRASLALTVLGLGLVGASQGAADSAPFHEPSSPAGAFRTPVEATQNDGEQLWTGAAGPNYYAGDALLQLHPLTAYPGAVCNDGTPAGYYYRQGTDPNLFVLFLEGGYWCTDEASCQGRMQNEPAEMSSAAWPPAIEAGGIFSTDPTQNPWAAATVAYAGYCSSDAWWGNAEAFGMQFRGQAIVNAVLQDLLQLRGMGPGSRLLFGGCSAGARGVMAQLDLVAQDMFARGIEVRGMLDSGIWIDVQPSDPNVESLADETKKVAAFVNPGPLIPGGCSQQYPGDDTWKCLFGQYRMPFLETPYFANEAQFDSFQVEYNNDGQVPKFQYQVQWADDFQVEMRNEMLTLPTGSQQQSGVFSSACLLHCVFDTPAFWTIRINGQSLESALAGWYFNDDAPVRIVDQSCTGWECHTACLPFELPALNDGPFGGEGGLEGPPAPEWYAAPPSAGAVAPSYQTLVQQQDAKAAKAAAAAHQQLVDAEAKGGATGETSEGAATDSRAGSWSEKNLGPNWAPLAPLPFTPPATPTAPPMPPQPATPGAPRQPGRPSAVVVLTESRVDRVGSPFAPDSIPQKPSLAQANGFEAVPAGKQGRGLGARDGERFGVVDVPAGIITGYSTTAGGAAAPAAGAAGAGAAVAPAAGVTAAGAGGATAPAAGVGAAVAPAAGAGPAGAGAAGGVTPGPEALPDHLPERQPRGPGGQVGDSASGALVGIAAAGAGGAKRPAAAAVAAKPVVSPRKAATGGTPPADAAPEPALPLRQAHEDEVVASRLSPAHSTAAAGGGEGRPGLKAAEAQEADELVAAAKPAPKPAAKPAAKPAPAKKQGGATQAAAVGSAKQPAGKAKAGHHGRRRIL